MADFLIESLSGQSSLSLEAPEVQMHDFLDFLKHGDCCAERAGAQALHPPIVGYGDTTAIAAGS